MNIVKKILLAVIALGVMTVAYANENPAVTAWKNWDADLKSYAVKTCEEYDVPVEVIFAIMWNESGYRQRALKLTSERTFAHGNVISHLNIKRLQTQK